MNMSEVLSYMEQPQVNFSKLGLENTVSLMARLGNPQDQLSFIHIAGTNGKGSTTTMTASMLIEARFKVGMFVSPYLQHFTEKICINGQPISEERFAQIGTRVIETIQEMVKEGVPHPTLFEITTAIGFVYYAEEQCDVVVLEVGLGGRLDTTNIIKTPLVSVITTLGLDHMDVLGDTLEKITYEKCGIIKQGGKVVTYPELPMEALSVIHKTVAETGSTWVKTPMPKDIHLSLDGSTFIHPLLGEVSISLLGEHQAKNACNAIEAVLASGLPVTHAQMIQGIKKARWAGRMELWQKKPTIVLDGAHNLQGMTQLVQNVKQYFGEKKVTILFGMLQEKEVHQSMTLLGTIADKIIVTEVPNPRTEKAARMGEIASTLMPCVTVEPSYQKALTLAKAITAIDEILLICGSLYLIGAIRKILSNEK